MKSKMLLFYAKLVFITALFGWIAYKLDYKTALLLISSARPAWGFAALVLAAVSFLFVNYRWKIIIKGFWANSKTSVWQLYFFNLLGVFYSLFVPTSIAAEAVRIWRLAKNEDSDYGKAAMTAIIDRIVGITTWFVLFLLLPSMLPKNKLLGLVFLVPVALYFFRDKIKIKERKIFDFSRHHPADIVYAVVFSLICQFFYLLAGYSVFKCFNVDIGLFFIAGIVAAGALANIVPVSMLGFGAREGFFIAVLPLYGVSHTEAVLITTFFVFISYVTGLSGGFLELMHTGWKLSVLKAPEIKGPPDA